jgi:glycosyltransferase involved in cell wall biosynthesis
MKILQAGNANFGYILARELRKRGIESDLLLSKESIKGIGVYGVTAEINDPLSHDQKLKSHPDWMIFDQINKKAKVFHIAKIMKNYDLIHAYQATSIHAMISGKPYIAAVGGDELRVKAFERSLTGITLKKSFKKASKVVYSWPILKPYIEKLGIKNAEYIPRIWDVEIIKKSGIEKENEGILKIFFPTAELWEVKGNEKFLNAFSRLCKENENIFLYYVDWGKDSKKAKEILMVPGVKDKVEFISGPISRENMAQYMEKSDILADQFNSGSFTRVGIESFFFGIPLLINIDEEIHQELHGKSPPVLNAKNENEIYEKLKYVLKNKSELKTIAEEAKEWAEIHFDLNKNVEKYVKIYESIFKK